MFYVTQGQLERSIYDLEQKFDFDFDGKTIRECITIILDKCPLLHNDKELEEHSVNLLHNIVEKFGYKALRVTYSVTNNIFGNDLLNMKYSKLIQDVLDYVEEYRIDNGLIYKLDVYRWRFQLRDTYKEIYGALNEKYCMDLYSVLNTIRLSHYNETVIKELEWVLYWELRASNLKYYYDGEEDYSKPSVLREMYEYLAEELGQEEMYQGHNLFYEYDGYGNTVINI